jgi:hypothetical protein
MYKRPNSDRLTQKPRSREEDAPKHQVAPSASAYTLSSRMRSVESSPCWKQETCPCFQNGRRGPSASSTCDSACRRQMERTGGCRKAFGYQAAILLFIGSRQLSPDQPGKHWQTGTFQKTQRPFPLHLQPCRAEPSRAEPAYTTDTRSRRRHAQRQCSGENLSGHAVYSSARTKNFPPPSSAWTPMYQLYPAPRAGCDVYTWEHAAAPRVASELASAEGERTVTRQLEHPEPLNWVSSSWVGLPFSHEEPKPSTLGYAFLSRHLSLLLTTTFSLAFIFT